MPIKRGPEPATAGESLENFALSPVIAGSGFICDLILGLAFQALCLRLLRRLSTFCAKPVGVEAIAT